MFVQNSFFVIIITFSLISTEVFGTCRFKTISSLSTHMGTSHKENVLIKHDSFSDVAAFHEWKSKEERQTQSSFVQSCGTKRTKSTEYTYYYCNRQGHFCSRSNGKRVMKSQGTCKLVEHCTAYIKMTKCVTDGTVSIQYCTSHSHEVNIGHLRLPNDVRVSIATKLQDGIQSDKILDQIRDNVSPKTLGREHLISKQDIHNIEKQFCVDGVQKHLNDSQSVNAWVQELHCSEYSPVLLYKMQGVEDVAIGTTSAFSRDDFALCIQTKFQCDMLSMFGKNAICIDSTHSTNQYDFLLNTIMVIDEFGEGIPVAYLISNHETGAVIEAFYEAIKCQVGMIEPLVFMTDDAPQYFTAWQNQFGRNSRTQKLLCRWHLDKTWRGAIREKVSSDLQPEIYRYLLVLLHETTLAEFNKKLQQFLSFLKEKKQHLFLEYFQKNYCNRTSQWATYARCYTSVNTNMHIEAFHRLVKTVYFQQKQNRRVDALLNVLLKLARDKAFERLIKTEKGKLTHKISEVNKRHTSAEKVSECTTVTSISQDHWTIKSAQGQSSYTIKKSSPQACSSCPLKCSHCGVCMHMYSCTCLDSILHSTACKHVHLVHMHMQQQLSCTEQSDEQSTGDTLNQSDNEEYSTTFPQYLERTNSDNKFLTESLVTTCREIQQIIPSISNIAAKRAANKQLKSTLSLLKASISSENVTLQPTRKYAANKHHEKQQRFYSTRQKKASTSSRWSKPTAEEQVSISNELATIEVKFCGICFKEDDGNSECDFNEWVECCGCDIWIHTTCSSKRGDLEFCHFC